MILAPNVHQRLLSTQWNQYLETIYVTMDTATIMDHHIICSEKYIWLGASTA